MIRIIVTSWIMYVTTNMCIFVINGHGNSAPLMYYGRITILIPVALGSNYLSDLDVLVVADIYGIWRKCMQRDRKSKLTRPAGKLCFTDVCAFPNFLLTITNGNLVSWYAVNKIE